MDIQCIIIEVLPEQRGNGSRGEWVKHQFLAETIGQYPKKLKFDVWSDERWQKMLPYIIPTAEVKVSFDIESKEWKDNWFTQLNAFSVYAGSNAQPAQQQDNNVQAQPQPAMQPKTVAEAPLPYSAPAEESGDVADDLPF